jgi:hypothetical protein
MADEHIVDKVRKLLELSKDPNNVNEAANAANAAQKLMSEHAISEAMVDVSPDEDEREDIEADLLHGGTGKQLGTWKGRLGVVMCEVNQCKCYRSGSDLRIIGRPSDANTVRYLFSYVAKRIDQLASEEARFRGNAGRTWLNNFRLGAVEEVTRRLKEADAEARRAMRQQAFQNDSNGSGAAIVKVDNALAKIDEQREAVNEFGRRKLGLKRGHKSRTRYDHGARKAGARAGKSIDLQGSGKGLGAGGRRKLGGG